jgi:hypothetical protein
MATLSATQNGNINDPSTWGGTIPTSIDILDARQYIINVNTNSLYSKLINTLGGYFLLSDGIGLSAEIENTQTLGLSGYCLLYDGTSSSSITGRVKGGRSDRYYGVYIDNSNHLIVNGNVTGGLKLNANVGGGIGIKSSVNAQGSLLVNGDIGLEGTLTNPVSARYEFAAINSEALSSIEINGDIFLPGSNNASIVNSVEGLQGLIVKNSSNSPINPTVKVNGDIVIEDYHGYGASMTAIILGVSNVVAGINYRGNTSTLTTPGLIEVNGNIINSTINTYYYGVHSIGNTNIKINGDIICGTQGTIPLRVLNNNNSTITLSSNSGFTGNINGTSVNWMPVHITTSNNLTINILGDVKNQFLRLGSQDSTTLPVTNSTLNIEGNILNIGGAGSIRVEDYCINLTINIVGNIYGGTSSTQAIHLRAVNRTNNLRLNVFATEIIGGTNATAIFTDAYDQNIFFNINAEEIAANPSGGNGHAIQAIERYLGSVKINAKRILDNFAGITALYVRSYDLSDVPNDAIIRYAAAPFAGFGPYVIHSTINSLSTFQMPPPEAVREGVIYASGSLTGACRIPSVSSVLLGTPVGAPDGNVGIATLDESLLNYDAIYNAPLTAFNYPNSVGEKLRAGPTTEIVGELIESFFPVH